MDETDDLDILTADEPETVDTPETDAEPEKLSVREQIERSWKEHGGELPDRPRDEKSGRFKADKPAKNSNRDAPVKAAPVKADKAAPVPSESQRTEAAPQSSSAAPNGWSGEAKASWNSLPPAVQAAVTKREQDMTAGAQKLQERYGGIHRIVSTHLTQPAQKYGLTPDKLLENAVSWFSLIEQNPAEGLKALAKTYNLDASHFGAAAPAPAGGASNGQAQPYSDPRVDQLARAFTEMQQNRSQEAKQAELKAWAANKPHYDQVRQAMAQIVAGAAQMQDHTILTDDGGKVDLDKVYDKAIYMVPEVRAAVLKEQAEERRKAREAQVNNARRAGASVKPGTPGGGSLRNGADKKLPKGASVRESIQAAMAELRS